MDFPAPKSAAVHRFAERSVRRWLTSESPYPDLPSRRLSPSGPPRSPLLDRQWQRLPVQPPAQLDQRRDERELRGHDTRVIQHGALGASNVTLSPGFGSVSPNGTQQVSPENTITYTLNASNSKGFNERSITIFVKPRPKRLAQPEGVFSYRPAQPQVGGLITFDSSKSTGTGSNINYFEWNFGDGNYNSSKVCLHSYDKAGNYTVVLAVTDDNGQKNFTLKQISVLPRELAVDSFNFTPNPVCSGQTTVMSWSTTGATNVVITPGVGNLPSSGSTQIFSEQSTGYTIQA